MTLTRGTAPDLDGLGVLRGAGTAVVVGDLQLSHDELDALVARRADQLGSTRRLVLLECANALDPLVTYLAALRGGHPVLLLPSLGSAAAERQWERIVHGYDPDLLCLRGEDGRWTDTEVRPGTRHDLHPDLAVLLGTSGSTGTPKLVRLSRENLRSNAAAIAGYLHLGPDSRAATTLPMQYCYGLSVVNSHLVAGGSLWLTDASVVDPGFWDDFDRAGATSFAGVPYTFDLLARSGVHWLSRPGLRQVTQAGGRMAPERVRDLALRAADEDVELVVMYGQTEATARMAYLPPHLAAERPACIGVPIDGGELAIRDGELVYTGPNVMLGYAESAADLALGATLTELRTGDLAVQHDDGLFEIVGRCNRLAKLYGVRLDLDVAERMLAEDGTEARCVAADDRLHVFVRDPGVATTVAARLVADHCLPPHAVRTHVLDELPVTASGKPDHGALAEAAISAPAVEDPRDVRAAYAGVFGPGVTDDDSFVSLRGDSLSYVEVFTRLERILGTVPTRWPELTVAELAATVRRPRRLWAWLETPMVLRAAAIVLLVGAHVGLWTTQGGAHVLLAVVGYNLTRFALSAGSSPLARMRAAARSLADVLAPTVVIVSGVILVRGEYSWESVLQLHNLLGANEWTQDWQLWFVEAMTWTVLPLALLLSLPGVAAAYRRWPFPVTAALLGIAVLVRETTLPAEGPVAWYSPQATAWAILIGVVVASARTPRERVVAAGLAAASTLDFFVVPLRGYLVIGAAVLLLTIPRLPVPRPLDRLVSVVASASLFVYLTHWQVYPDLEDAGHRVWALLASVAVGVAAWWLWTSAVRQAGRLRQALSRTGSASRPKTIDFVWYGRSAGSIASSMSGNRRASAG